MSEKFKIKRTFRGSAETREGFKIAAESVPKVCIQCLSEKSVSRIDRTEQGHEWKCRVCGHTW